MTEPVITQKINVFDEQNALKILFDNHRKFQDHPGSISVSEFWSDASKGGLSAILTHFYQKENFFDNPEQVRIRQVMLQAPGEIAELEDMIKFNQGGKTQKEANIRNLYLIAIDILQRKSSSQQITPAPISASVQKILRDPETSTALVDDIIENIRIYTMFSYHLDKFILETDIDLRAASNMLPFLQDKCNLFGATINNNLDKIEKNIPKENWQARWDEYARLRVNLHKEIKKIHDLLNRNALQNKEAIGNQKLVIDEHLLNIKTKIIFEIHTHLVK